MRRVKRFGALLLVMAILFTGCGKTEEKKDNEGMTTSGKELTVGIPFFDELIDPAVDYHGWQVMRYGVGETLVKIDESMITQPWLAEEYKVIDETNWEFTIKEGVKFHSGRDMTVKSIIDSINRTMDISDRAKLALKGVTFEESGNKLIVKSDILDPILPEKLSDPMFIIVDVLSDGEENFEEKPICTGPFKIESFYPKEKATMVKFDEYWDKPANIDRLNYILIGDSNTRMMALQSNEIDLTMNLTASALNVFEKDDNYKIDKSTSMKLIYLMFNKENKHLENRLVRDAINYAIDRDTLAEVTLNNTVVATQSPYPKNLPFGSEKIKGYEYDLNKAKSLLEEAGYEEKDGFMYKDGEILQLNLTNYSSRAEIPLIAQFLQGELAKIGMKIELVQFETLPVDQYNAGNFDIGFDGYTIATSPDPKRLLDIGFVTDGSDNFNNYFKSEKVNEISKILETEANPEKRYELGYKAQEAIMEEGVNAFLCFTQNNIVRHKNINNFYVHPLDYYQMNENVEKN